MKKNDWLLAGAVAAYSYLFYEQQAGINYLIFTLILLGLIVVQTKKSNFQENQLAAHGPCQFAERGKRSFGEFRASRNCQRSFLNLVGGL